MSHNALAAAPPTRHYHWAGLDFMFDRDGTPVLIEANKSSHMLGEYLHFVGDERPFELAAEVMNRAGGTPCLLWRRDDPLPNADEDACFIGRKLENYLAAAPVICNVEDNRAPHTTLLSRDGREIQPGSLFRWWYGLPWSYERAGVTVINPNAVWVTVRDKLNCYRILMGADPATLIEADSQHEATPAECSHHAPTGNPVIGHGPTHFRVPRAFAVETIDDARRILAAQSDLFTDGYVLKPRVGWGGAGAQIAEPAEEPRDFQGRYLLSERIIPPDNERGFWEVRVFVMAGVYLGGIKHVSATPNTNYWQGGRPQRLDDDLTARLEQPALEAVRLLDTAADRIHSLPEPPRSALTTVSY